ncbi:MAG: GerMN domain-containing protein [Actinomycetota bacterium]|jgi:spore germination protein GerM
MRHHGTRRPALTAAVVLAVVALALSGCGVPSDSSPRTISADRVPFGLLEPDDGRAPTTAGPGATATTVYLVGDERLVAAERDVAGPPGVATSIRALLSGPTEAEARRGLRTAVPPTAAVALAATVGDTVTLDLSRWFTEAAGGPEEVLAIAQIVYTVTGVEGVGAARFTLAGRAVEVPGGDGTLRSGALRRTDFPLVGPA